MPITVAVPEAVPVKVTEQLPADNAQLEALREPPVVPADNVKVTEPVGVLDVTFRSVTVAIQVEPWLMTTVPGLQTTTVDVVSLRAGLTVIVAAGLAGLAL